MVPIQAMSEIERFGRYLSTQYGWNTPQATGMPLNHGKISEDLDRSPYRI